MYVLFMPCVKCFLFYLSKHCFRLYLVEVNLSCTRNFIVMTYHTFFYQQPCDFHFSIPLTPSDPQWVGAWWIGIVIAVPAFILISFPIHGYPRRLPGN